MSAFQSAYVRVAPSPRFKETQSSASEELVQLRVRHLLPKTTQLARERVGKLKRLFSIRHDVLLHDHEACMAASLMRMRLAKAVRNIKVQGGGGNENGGSGVIGALCLPFYSCAALPNPAVSSPGTQRNADVQDRDPALVLTGAVDGLLTLWDGERCHPLSSRSTYARSRGWGRIKSIAVHPQQNPGEEAGTSATAVSPAPSSFVFTASMYQDEVLVWRVSPANERCSVDEAVPRANTADRLQPLTAASCVASSAGGNSGVVGGQGGLQQVAVDPTGALLAASHANSTVSLWDARLSLEGPSFPSAKLHQSSSSTTTAAAPLTHLYTQDGYETAGATLGLSFHPDGSLLTTSDAGGRVVSWDTRSGQLAFHTGGRVGGHLRAAPCVAWSPCGVRLASGGADGVVHLYDARKLSKAGLGPHDTSCSGAAPFQLFGHDDAVTSISFYTNPVDSSTAGWNATVRSAAHQLLPLGIITTSLDHKLRIWDADTGLCVRTFDAGMPLHAHCRPQLPPCSPAFSSSTSIMVVGHGKNWLLYDVSSAVGDEKEEVELRAGNGEMATGGVADVVVTDSKVVASRHGGTSGMKLAVETDSVPGAGRQPFGNEESTTDDDDDEDEMALLRKQPPAAAAASRNIVKGGETEEDDDDSSEDEMALLKRNNNK